MITTLHTQNLRVLMARAPVGLPTLEDFSFDTCPVPQPKSGEFLTRTLYLSLDPYYRNVMKNSPIYAERMTPGDLMIGEAIAEVIASQHAEFSAGDIVSVRNGWQQYAISDGKGVQKN